MCLPTTSEFFEEILICPITLELPLVPVMAMDGKVYEKQAIETHYMNTISLEGFVRSPLTTETISPKLLPATQHKNVIETAVEQGILTGELADNWKQRMDEKTNFESLQQKAGKGDVHAMAQVGYNYANGFDGFPCDMDLAYWWSEQAHYAGSTVGTAFAGFMLLKGMGVDPNPARGLRLLTKAAHEGSAWAACRLGLALADGRHGLVVDRIVAIHWLEVSLNGACLDDNAPSGKSKAREKLDEILANTTDPSWA